VTKKKTKKKGLFLRNQHVQILAPDLFSSGSVSTSLMRAKSVAGGTTDAAALQAGWL
jgi:hypothetical protein